MRECWCEVCEHTWKTKLKEPKIPQSCPKCKAHNYWKNNIYLIKKGEKIKVPNGRE